MFQEQIDEVKQKIKLLEPSMKVLKNLDLFVLDNSLRETTVGQLRGHTIDNKWQIYNEVCSFKTACHIYLLDHYSCIFKLCISNGENV